MKFTATKENMITGISTVQKAISTKNTIAVLGGIFLKAEKNHLIFAATDLDIAIECRIPAEIVSEGSIVLPARYFSELVRRLPDEKLIFDNEENPISMKILYENAETYINGWLGEEFPRITEIQNDTSFLMDPTVLKNIVKQTTFCANTEDIRPVFTGALMEVEENRMKMVSTDSYRLAYKECVIQNPQSVSIKKVVPVKALQEISRILKEDDDQLLTIRCNQNQMCFENNEVRFMTRLIDATYPNYEQVIPKTYTALVKAKKKNLQNTVDRATLFTTEKDGSNVLHFYIKENKINILSKSEYGMVDENIGVYHEGEDMNIAFNAKYLMDAFKNMEYEDLEITFGGSLSPAIFRGLNDKNFLYLLLPMRS